MIKKTRLSKRRAAEKRDFSIILQDNVSRSHSIHAYFKTQSPHLNIDNIPYNDRIELAITDLKSQITLNYAATAKKYNVDRSTLSRRYKGAIISKAENLSKIHKILTDVQEDVLV
jgi:S-adenosylmethionine synthetase